MKKRKLILGLVVLLGLMTGCGSSSGNNVPSASTSLQSETTKQVTLNIAAAASLKNVFDDNIIPMFEEEYKNIDVSGIYDSSGKLQTQIENGLDADLFFSAAKKQMNALTEEGYMDESLTVDLLENKLVLIKNIDKKSKILEVEIVDKELINYTGGIIQGMSGAPIIQNDKLIGSITYVLKKNPKKGFGIFIGEMIK